MSYILKAGLPPAAIHPQHIIYAAYNISELTCGGERWANERNAISSIRVLIAVVRIRDFELVLCQAKDGKLC